MPQDEGITTTELMTLDSILVPCTDRIVEAGRCEDGTILVSLRRVCEALGIDVSSQVDKLRARSWATVVQKASVGADGRQREMTMIDTRTLGGWLMTIDENRVSDESRPTVIAFQQEAVDAIDAHFSGRAASNTAFPAEFMRELIRAKDETIAAKNETIATLAQRPTGVIDAVAQTVHRARPRSGVRPDDKRLRENMTEENARKKSETGRMNAHVTNHVRGGKPNRECALCVDEGLALL